MPFKKFRYGTVSIKMMQNQIELRKSDAGKLFYAILLSGLADDRHTLFCYIFIELWNKSHESHYKL